MNNPAAKQLEDLFAQCFFLDYRTVLRGAAPEPLYQPAIWPRHCHRIYYREDFFASALHEVAHWCIAGAERRQLADYGYWYHPDGRCGEKQRHFEQVEREPQAVEWHFSLACRSGFRISNDNLADPAGESGDFGAAVHSQALRYCSDGLPSRAANFRTALAGSFAGIAEPEPGDFCAQGV